MNNFVVFNPRNFYNKLFLEYKNYIETNSIYKPIVRKTIPKKFAQFPTIIFKSDNNYPILEKTTINLVEYFTHIEFLISIYTVDKGTVVKEMFSDEVSYLTRQFLAKKGLLNMVETDIEAVDNTLLTRNIDFSCKVKNNNEQIFKI